MKSTTRYTIKSGCGPLADGQTIELEQGRPLADAPKTWKKLGLFSLVEMPTTHYNTNVFTLYRAKDGTLRWSVYRDGCFYAFHGRLGTPDIAKEKAAKIEGVRLSLRRHLADRHDSQRWIRNNARIYVGVYVRELRSLHSSPQGIV